MKSRKLLKLPVNWIQIRVMIITLFACSPWPISSMFSDSNIPFREIQRTAEPKKRPRMDTRAEEENSPRCLGVDGSPSEQDKQISITTEAHGLKRQRSELRVNKGLKQHYEDAQHPKPAKETDGNSKQRISFSSWTTGSPSEIRAESLVSPPSGVASPLKTTFENYIHFPGYPKVGLENSQGFLDARHSADADIRLLGDGHQVQNTGQSNNSLVSSSFLITHQMNVHAIEKGEEELRSLGLKKAFGVFCWYFGKGTYDNGSNCVEEKPKRITWMQRTFPILVYDIKILCQEFPDLLAGNNMTVEEIQLSGSTFFREFWKDLSLFQQFEVDEMPSQLCKVDGMPPRRSILEDKKRLEIIRSIEAQTLCEPDWENPMILSRKFLALWMSEFYGEWYKRVCAVENEDLNRRFISTLNELAMLGVPIDFSKYTATRLENCERSQDIRQAVGAHVELLDNGDQVKNSLCDSNHNMEASKRKAHEFEPQMSLHRIKKLRGMNEDKVYDPKDKMDTLRNDQLSLRSSEPTLGPEAMSPRGRPRRLASSNREEDVVFNNSSNLEAYNGKAPSIHEEANDVPMVYTKRVSESSTAHGQGMVGTNVNAIVANLSHVATAGQIIGWAMNKGTEELRSLQIKRAFGSFCWNFGRGAFDDDIVCVKEKPNRIAWMQRLLPILMYDIKILCQAIPGLLAEKNMTVEEIQLTGWAFFQAFWKKLFLLQLLKLGKMPSRHSIMKNQEMFEMIEFIEQQTMGEPDWEKPIILSRKFLALWMSDFCRELYEQMCEVKNGDLNQRLVSILNELIILENSIHFSNHVKV